jgi:hypothetical protein
VSLTFSGVAPTNFTLTAWKTHYQWYEGDSSFSSSNATLNAVWELCRYTLEAASLDTYGPSSHLLPHRHKYPLSDDLSCIAALVHWFTGLQVHGLKHPRASAIRSTVESIPTPPVAPSYE